MPQKKKTKRKETPKSNKKERKEKKGSPKEKKEMFKKIVKLALSKLKLY
jgi:hypothetical protein